MYSYILLSPSLYGTECLCRNPVDTNIISTLIIIFNCCGLPKFVSHSKINVTYLKLLHGCMTQWPAAFCLMRSFISAFLDPNSFMANLLSVGWKRACSWFRRKPCLASVAGGAGSTGVPYKDTSSKPPKWTLPVPLPCFSDISASPEDKRFH